jgi:ribosomal-protein-alanine N-acetyltransferase
MKMNISRTAPVEIVRMQEADINSVLEILIENKLEAWSYDDFFSEIHRKDTIVLIGRRETEIVGFCVARLIISKTFSSNFNSKNDNYAECEIYNIAVKKKYQEQGIGRQILDKLVCLAKERHSQSIWLEVRSSNTNAINFYLKNNFERIYERKNFYSNPLEDAIVMKRKLQ